MTSSIQKASDAGGRLPFRSSEELDRERDEKKEEAQHILRGKGGDPEGLLDLANSLKELNEFGYARRLLGRAREQSIQDAKIRLRLGQRHCLCTYKDPDLPLHQRLQRAFEILQEVDDLGETTDQETLGLAGAIYKRKWQVDTDKGHLERALSYYLRGYGLNPQNDQGYTGINAAYILDLLAHTEEADAAEANTVSTTAETRRKDANLIRRKLVEVLPPLLDMPEYDWLDEWWFPATVAEAYFGLGEFDKATEWLKRAKALSKRPPLWEFESTAVQLASLARLRPDTPGNFEQLQRTEGWRVVEELLDHRADAVETVFAGKLGLALSGGGFRASLFHIGVLAKMAELDLLRHVHVLSCVSGGSIVGAHYYLGVRELLQNKPDRKPADSPGGDTDAQHITRDDYIKLIEDLAREFHAGVSCNIRTRVASNLWLNLKMAFSSTYSRTVRAGELFEKKLFNRVRKNGSEKLFLNELEIEPKRESGGHETRFKPKEENWLRRNKVPMLVLNATTLNTGHNWQFTASWMGESPFSIDPEVDGNWRFRRVYYRDAPAPYKNLRLGQAVGASACVPGLFEPVALPGLYPEDDDSKLPEMMVRLVDGGVHDNQGVASILEQDCTAIFVSDASGQMTSEAEPKNGVIGPLLRSNTSVMERVRQLQFFDLKARRRTSLLKNLTITHLKKGLEGEAVNWRRCKDPADEPLRRRGDLLDYGVSRKVQELLATIRTDLDAFSEVESHSLMASGYLMAEHYAKEIENLPMHDGRRHEWEFLRVESALRGDAEPARQKDFEKLLKVGSQPAFKVWKMYPLLSVLAVLLALAAAGGFIWACLKNPEFPLVNITLRDVGVTLGWTIAGLVLGKTVVSVIRFKDTLSKVLKDIAVAFGGFAIAQLHLWPFNWLFLRRGKVERVLGKPPSK